MFSPPVCLSIARSKKRKEEEGEFKRFFCSQKPGSREEEEEEERGDIYRFPTLEEGGREGEENILGARQEQEGGRRVFLKFQSPEGERSEKEGGKGEERSFANKGNREIGLCSEYFE